MTKMRATLKKQVLLYSQLLELLHDARGFRSGSLRVHKAERQDHRDGPFLFLPDLQRTDEPEGEDGDCKIGEDAETRGTETQNSAVLGAFERLRV